MPRIGAMFLGQVRGCRQRAAGKMPAALRGSSRASTALMPCIGTMNRSGP